MGNTELWTCQFGQGLLAACLGPKRGSQMQPSYSKHQSPQSPTFFCLASFKTQIQYLTFMQCLFDWKLLAKFKTKLFFFTELLSKLKFFWELVLPGFILVFLTALSIFASEWRSKYLSFWMYWSEAVYSCSLASVSKMWTTNIFKWGASHNEVAVF